MTLPPGLAFPEFYQGTVYFNDVVFTGVGAEIVAVFEGYQTPSVVVTNGYYKNILVQTIPVGSAVSFLLRLRSGKVFESRETDVYEEGFIHFERNPVDLHFTGRTSDLDPDEPAIPPASPQPPTGNVCTRVQGIATDINALIDDLTRVRDALS